MLITAGFVMPAFSDDEFKNSKETFAVKANGNLVNLKYGGIIADSEEIYLNGVRLDKSKSEYSIDYSAAVIIINKLMNIGDRIEADYCYKPNTNKTAFANGSSVQTLNFTNNKNNLNMSMLYNAADVTTGKSTYGTNLKTDFGLGFTLDSTYYASTGDDSNGNFNLHRLAYKNGGLDFNIGYQDSSDTFGGMNYVTSLGKIQGDAGQIAKESGLKRYDFGLNYQFANFGNLKLGYNSLEDNSGDIKNSNFSYSNTKLNLAYSSQEIGDFLRFDDIRETDRAVMKNERGVSRNNFVFGYDFGVKFGKLNFSQNTIDFNDNDIKSKTLSFDNTKLKFSYYNRDVDALFGNFGNLREADRDQLAAEAGVERTKKLFSFDVGKKDAAKWQTYTDILLRTDDGESLKAKSFSVNYSDFDFAYFTLKTDEKFNRMNALNGEERNDFSGYARKLFDYNQGKANADDTDRNSWYSQAGINRDMKFLKYNMNKDSYFTFANQKLSLFNDADLDTSRFDYRGKFKGKDLKFYYYKDDIDKDFNRLANLTNIEKIKYNNMYGMKNFSYGMDGTFDFGYLKFDDNKIKDSVSASGYSRRYFNYAVPKYNISYVNTKIDDAFSRVADINDPNRETYASWKGFDRKEYTANMKFGSAKKTFDINTYFMKQNHESLDNRFKQNSVVMNYVPDTRFNFSYSMNKYNHEINNTYDIDNKETVLKMNKLINVGKLTDNSIFAQYRTNSFLENSLPVNQKFTDLKYKTDAKAKFAVNFDYNMSEYSQLDKRKSYDLYANQKITDKFGLIFGYGGTDFSNQEKENRIKYGVSYSVNDSFVMSYNIDKTIKGDSKLGDNKTIKVSGKLPKIINDSFINNVNVNFNYILNRANEQRNTYNDNYNLNANIFKGAFTWERSLVLDSATKSWYNDISKLLYKNDSLFGSKFGLDLSRISTTNATTKVIGQVEKYKFNYTLNDRLTASYALNKGTWNENNLIPIRSEEISFNSKVGADNVFSLKYSQNRNSILNKNDREWGIAFNNNGKQKKGKFNIYAGLATDYSSSENNRTRLVYSVEYEYMLSKEKFLSVVASKTTDIKSSNGVDDYSSENVGLDYRTSF